MMNIYVHPQKWHTLPVVPRLVVTDGQDEGRIRVGCHHLLVVKGCGYVLNTVHVVVAAYWQLKVMRIKIRSNKKDSIYGN